MLAVHGSVLKLRPENIVILVVGKDPGTKTIRRPEGFEALALAGLCSYQAQGLVHGGDCTASRRLQR